MDIILIPGLWLDGSSWEKVVPVLQQAGHRTHPITLPGMESRDGELAKIRHVDDVDLPTGHRPQFTRPEDLGRAILGSTLAPPVDARPMAHLDEHARPEPPLAADETATLLGFLEYQRASDGKEESDCNVFPTS